MAVVYTHDSFNLKLLTIIFVATEKNLHFNGSPVYAKFILIPSCVSRKLLENLFLAVYAGMEDHMANTPGLYTSGRSTSSSSSPGVPGSSPALLVVPQPINATKMGGMQNGGVQPRKYQCKMCPQVSFCDTKLIWKRQKSCWSTKFRASRFAFAFFLWRGVNLWEAVLGEIFSRWSREQVYI